MDNLNEQRRDQGEPAEKTGRVSRRFFLRGSGLAVAGGIGTVAGRQSFLLAQEIPATPMPAGGDPVPDTPPAAPPPTLRYFRPDQAQFVEAIAARLIPGTPDDPGAREAGVVYYIDGLLAHADGYSRATYRQGPWAMTYEGEAPPAEASRLGDSVIWVHADQIGLYGFQSPLTLRESYVGGLAGLSRFATEQFGGDFVSLSGDQQDQILAAMEDGDATGFDAPTATAFFELLMEHTIQGFFADPVYGGNRDMAGWRMVGFPGAQRAYSPRELKTEGTDRQPQSMADLAHFHAGRPEDGPINPVRGSDDDAEDAGG